MSSSTGLPVGANRTRDFYESQVADNILEIWRCQCCGLERSFGFSAGEHAAGDAARCLCARCGWMTPHIFTGRVRREPVKDFRQGKQ